MAFFLKWDYKYYFMEECETIDHDSSFTQFLSCDQRLNLLEWVLREAVEEHLLIQLPLKNEKGF